MFIGNLHVVPVDNELHTAVWQGASVITTHTLELGNTT